MQLRTVCCLRAVQSEPHSSWQQHSSVSVGNFKTHDFFEQLFNFSSKSTLSGGDGQQEQVLKYSYCLLLSVTVFLCESGAASSIANINSWLEKDTLSPTGSSANCVEAKEAG